MQLHVYPESGTNIYDEVAHRTPLRPLLLRRSLLPVFPRGARPSSYWRGSAFPFVREGHQNAWQAQKGTTDHDRARDTGPRGYPR